MAISLQSDLEWQTALQKCKKDFRGVVAVYYSEKDSAEELENAARLAGTRSNNVTTVFLRIDELPHTATVVEKIEQTPAYRAYHPGGNVFGVETGANASALHALYDAVDCTSDALPPTKNPHTVALIASDADWEEFTLNLSTPCVVQFSASWCGPCKRMYAQMDQSAANFGAQCAFARVDIDGAPETARIFGVSSVPNFVALDKNMQFINNVVGAKSSALSDLINQTLNLDSAA